jgi:hypothetical protein
VVSSTAGAVVGATSDIPSIVLARALSLGALSLGAGGSGALESASGALPGCGTAVIPSMVRFG